jgi:hypothetical protein
LYLSLAAAFSLPYHPGKDHLAEILVGLPLLLIYLVATLGLSKISVSVVKSLALSLLALFLLAWLMLRVWLNLWLCLSLVFLFVFVLFLLSVLVLSCLFLSCLVTLSLSSALSLLAWLMLRLSLA